MLQAVISQRRHSERYRQIVRTLVRHGLGGVIGPVGIRRRVRRAIPGMATPLDPAAGTTAEARPIHLRLAFEELGPTFIKLGQILSMRSDLLPPAYIAELERLQDNVPADPFPLIRVVIEQELGQPVEEAFAWIDESPLASASIGQVHAARLSDGREVVIKVQHPGVDARILQDLEILEELSSIAATRSSILRQADVVGLVKEFSWTLRSELDYRREAANAERFLATVHEPGTVRIPEIDATRTTRRVLTMERIEGVRIDHYRPGPDGVTRQELARRLVRSTANQILRTGMFHADPHPGNFLVDESGQLVILDFGMVGTIDDRVRERLMLLAIAIAGRDSSRIVDEVSLLGALPPGWDRHLMERDVSHLVTQYVGASLRDLPVSMVIADATSLVRRHGVRLPSELGLLAKTATMLEALSRQLDPDIDVVAVVEPVIRRASRELYSPAFWAKRFRLQPLDSLMLVSSLPTQIQRLLSRIDRNDLTFHIHYDELPETLRSLNGMVNRLAFSIMTAAAWLGTIFLYLAVDPDLTALPGALFLLVFAALVLMVAYGVFDIWRSNR